MKTRLITHKFNSFATFKIANSLKQRAIVHISDLEGNWSRLQHWAQLNPIVGLRDDHELYFKGHNIDSHFVFGGDAIDRGTADIKILRTLTDFKSKYPANVTLLAGNRETKCLRFLTELHPALIRSRILHGQCAWWSKSITPLEFVAASFAVEVGKLEQKINDTPIIELQKLYLQWMLRHNMGSPHAFEYRRVELQQQLNKTIDDRLVTQSFLDMLAPNGYLRKYLSQACIATIIDDTFFSHGAVNKTNCGAYPNAITKAQDPHTWVDDLNTWYAAQIDGSFRAAEQLCAGSEITPPGNSALDRYNLYNPKSVITSNTYVNKKLEPLDKDVQLFFSTNGISRQICGHQPFGAFPLIIVGDHNFTLIVNDTHFSEDVGADPVDDPINAVTVYGAAKQTRVEIVSMLRSNTISIRLPDAENLIGKFTADGWLIGAKDNSGYIIRKLDNGWLVLERKLAKSRLTLV